MEGACIVRQSDRRSSTFRLAQACDPLDVGLHAERMTLTARGLDVVLSGNRSALDDGAPLEPTDAIVVNLGGVDGCPPMTSPDPQRMVDVAAAAHLPARNGRFVAFAGDWRGTTELVTRDEAGWLAYDLDPSSAPADDDAPGSSKAKPNAIAARLDGDAAVVVRSAAARDPAASVSTPPIQIEWIDLTETAATIESRFAIPAGMPGFAQITSTRGQVRLFPAVDEPGRVVLVGDSGRAMALSRGQTNVERLPALARDPNADASASADVPPNLGAMTVLLPLRPAQSDGEPYRPGSIIFLGGYDGCTAADCGRAVDRLDPGGGVWTPGPPLPRPRRYGTATLLPDGRVLVAGGSEDNLHALYLDPRRAFTWTIGEDVLTRPRAGGVSALVLADGRVIIAGGRDSGADVTSVSTDAELWEPPYLHRHSDGARPAITDAPPQLAAVVPFPLTVAADSAGVVEVVLLAYGSSFRGNDLNQRLVELEIDRGRSDAGGGTLWISGPPPGWAPPGPYLLFALDADRVPSVGWPVDVVARPPPGNP